MSNNTIYHAGSLRNAFGNAITKGKRHMVNVVTPSDLGPEFQLRTKTANKITVDAGEIMPAGTKVFIQRNASGDLAVTGAFGSYSNATTAQATTMNGDERVLVRLDSGTLVRATLQSVYEAGKLAAGDTDTGETTQITSTVAQIAIPTTTGSSYQHSFEGNLGTNQNATLQIAMSKDGVSALTGGFANTSLTLANSGTGRYANMTFAHGEKTAGGIMYLDFIASTAVPVPTTSFCGPHSTTGTSRTFRLSFIDQEIVDAKFLLVRPSAGSLTTGKIVFC